MDLKVSWKQLKLGESDCNTHLDRSIFDKILTTAGLDFFVCFFMGFLPILRMLCSCM